MVCRSRSPKRGSSTSLVGRSPRTAATYRTALGRLHEYLESTGVEPDDFHTTEIRADLLERLYLWLTRSLRP